MINTKIADLDATELNGQELILIEALNEIDPSIDLRAGTGVRDLLVTPAAALAAKISSDVLTFKNSLSPASELVDLDPAVLDIVKDNYGVKDYLGTKATGKLKLTLVESVRLTIPVGYVFNTEEGIQVETPMTIEIDPEDITYTGSSYFVVVAVQAVEVGATSNIATGTKLSAETNSLTNIYSAEVDEPLAGGTNALTTREVFDKRKNLMATPDLSSTVGIANFLEDAELFPQVKATSVVGMGDTEMLRDSHNVFGVSVGGHVDVYVKTFDAPVVKTVVLDAVSQGGGVYTVECDNANSGHILAVESVAPAIGLTESADDNANDLLGSYDFTTTRGLDPDIHAHHEIDSHGAAILESYGSKWISTDIRIEGVAPVNIEGSLEYQAELPVKITYYAAPIVSRLQDALDDPIVRNKNCDILLKHAAPLFITISVSVTVDKLNTLDSEVVAKAISEFINNRPFSMQLTDTELSGVVYKQVSKVVDVTGLEISLKAVTPFGTVTLNGLDTISEPEVFSATGYATEANSTMICPQDSVFVNINYV